jgi:hypothetical protein
MALADEALRQEEDPCTNRKRVEDWMERLEFRTQLSDTSDQMIETLRSKRIKHRQNQP